jgi:serine-type D-Ala-D-Ala endopeptidase (penicillin-binding protein 7)
MKYLLIFLVLLSSSAYARKPSTVIYDLNKNEIVECFECNVPRPIASLTKVMTALVALEHDSDLSKPVKIPPGHRLPSGVHTRGDLFAAMLVRSDNYSSELLAQDYPGGRRAFIRAMNNRARELGMYHTRFADPSGLSSGNISTIGEVTTMIKVAALQPIIADTSVLPQIEIKNKRYKVLLENTNKLLLADFNEIKFSKTGFTTPAGWSVGMILERHDRQFLVIVLGARDKVHRYNLAKEMIHRHFAEIEHTITLEQKEISLWHKAIEKMFGSD